MSQAEPTRQRVAGALRLVFAGGGTGGHLFPAIAVADEIKERHPDAAILFVGTKGRIEATVVPARGYEFVTIWISGFRRRLSAATFLFPLKVIVSMVQSVSLLRRRRPEVVIGTGGYVCGPVVYAAQLLGIPTLIQEQNSYPGVTTRMLAPRATEVHLTFEESRRYLKRQSNVLITGNPTRGAIGTVRRKAGASAFGIDGTKRTVLVFGGSLGASSINRALLPAITTLVEGGLQILWQTGEQDQEFVLRGTEAVRGKVKVFKFIDRMENAYAAADLAVCRAGASSLAELTRLGLPAVLIPYPLAAADHQTANAKTMEAAGAAVVIADRDAARLLPALLKELAWDANRLGAMAEASRRLGKPKATKQLADAVEDLASGNRQ